MVDALFLSFSLFNARNFLDINQLSFHLADQPGSARLTRDGRMRSASFFLNLPGKQPLWVSDRQMNLLQVLRITSDHWATAEELDTKLREVTGQRVDGQYVNAPTEVKDWAQRIKGLNQALADGLGRPLVQIQEVDGRLEFKAYRGDSVQKGKVRGTVGEGDLYSASEGSSQVSYRGVTLKFTPKEFNLLKLVHDHPSGISVVELRQLNKLTENSTRPFALAKEINAKSFLRTGARLLVVNGEMFHSQRLAPAVLNAEQTRRYQDHELHLTPLELYVFDALELGKKVEPVRYNISFSVWERRLNIRPRQFIRMLEYINRATVSALGTPAVEGVTIPDPLLDHRSFAWRGADFEETHLDKPVTAGCASLL